MFFSKVLNANYMSLCHYATPNISTMGFRVFEGASQNLGGRRGWGSDKVMFMATGEKVGTPAGRIIIGELLVERARLWID